jgi:hypothetical protein
MTSWFRAWWRKWIMLDEPTAARPAPTSDDGMGVILPAVLDTHHTDGGESHSHDGGSSSHGDSGGGHSF